MTADPDEPPPTDAAPPFGRTWGVLYAGVLVVLAAVIVALVWLTGYYR